MATRREQLTIRTATADDAAAMARLSGQLGYPSSPGQITERLALIRRDAGHEVLVGERAGDVVGWVHVLTAHRVESDPFAEVAGLVVEEAARSRGVGAALLAAAEQWALAQGYRVMRVRCNVVRDAAHRFYEREGYTAMKRSVVFVKQLEAGAVRPQ